MYRALIALLLFTGNFRTFCSDYFIEKNRIPNQKINNSPFIGKWSWIKSNDDLSFGIDIKQVNNMLIGQYCGTANSGNRTDCATDNDISFEIPVPAKNVFTCNFKSAYSGNKGVVQLYMKGKYLIWKIIKAPKGEYYCPDIAKLAK